MHTHLGLGFIHTLSRAHGVRRAIGQQEVPLWGGNSPGKLRKLDMGSLRKHVNLCFVVSTAAHTAYMGTACRFLLGDQLSDEAGKSIQLKTLHPFLWKDIFSLALPKEV